MIRSLKVLCWLLMMVLPVKPIEAWQDDLDINLRHPLEQFSPRDGVIVFNKALAEIRLGRYLVADQNHGWRGGVMGNISLLATPTFMWNMGLAQETLADDHNDINFRLNEAYYQALTGLNWLLGPGVFKLGFRHRCSHGIDNAVENRITIRSGPVIGYHGWFSLNPIKFFFEAGINYYLFGQNTDLSHQQKGNLFLAIHSDWTFKEPYHLVFSAGMHTELFGHGLKTVYGPFDSNRHLGIVPLFSSRLALRRVFDHVTTDLMLSFIQNADSAMSLKTKPTSSLLGGIDFLW